MNGLIKRVPLRTDRLMSGSSERLGGNLTPYGGDFRGRPERGSYYKGNKIGGQRLQILGNGYRFYSPTIAKFIQADPHSPFGMGGLNGYCYCNNDPVNRYDPDGRASIGKIFSRLFRSVVRSKTAKKPAVVLGDVPLRNHYPELLKKEYDLFAHNYRADPRKIVRNQEDFAALESGIEYKFVYTDESHFVTAPYVKKGTDRYISHAVVAELLPQAKIQSAGLLTKGSMGEVMIINQSGHYRPVPARLEQPRRQLTDWLYEVSVGHVS